MDRISIVGLGLIGTSVGLAIKKAKLPVELVGHDKEPTNAGKARKRGAVDKVEYNLPSAVTGAKLVILAVPVMAIREVMEVIAPHLEEGAVVTDTGSTKAAVLAWADQYLAPRVHFVGAHPMAGKEQSGPDAADADLFRNAVCCVVPSTRASEQAVKTVVGLAETLGARPYFVDAAEHDSYVAAVSHLPFLLSVTLVNTTAKGRGWREMASLAASGYRDISRLASGDPEMHRDICLTNRDSIVYWLDEFIKDLYALRNQVKDGGQDLLKTLNDAWEARTKWVAGVQPEAQPPMEVPKPSESMLSLFVGSKLAQRIQQSGSKDQDKGKPQR
ncbi:MAG: prephenate dehydrogenase/arogenate dehydrogenase family protein [Chloroflexi bacterium]|nr:prephenate dehydrogenase/arogenate dehydrogenase family protein [Chloroflexota bacterium]